MADTLSELYQDLLCGSYDCVDRIVLNGYFRQGHSGGGFRVWWQRLYGSDKNLDNTHLMRLVGRFGRRIYSYAQAHNIPVIKMAAGERKHELAEEYLAKTKVTRGVFLILVGRAPAPVWSVSGKHHLARRRPMPYVNHYSFHILDAEWGHITIKISGHPPFPAQVMLNGHEYVACQARKVGLSFTKEGNCFTSIADAAGLARIAETLSDPLTIGRLSQVCERWIYTACLCFALDLEEQQRSGFRYQYSNYQIEYSRNLIFKKGQQMEEIFQALVDRSRAPLDIKRVKTILGCCRRPKFRWRKKKSQEWEVSVEKPTYDLTIFKLHCHLLSLKVYTKGERTLRIEATAHNTGALDCGRSLEKFTQIVERMKGILERFMAALSCIDACFISDETLELLPRATQVGKTRVGGIDFNQPRMRRVAEAVLILASSSQDFTAAQMADQVRSLCSPSEANYRRSQAAYDLKKLRGKQFIRRVPQSRRYEPVPSGLKALAALLLLRDKIIKPLLAAAQSARKPRGPKNPTALDLHYECVRVGMRGVFQELGLAA
jgi:hypothetical protein